jgi:hypothetical protein
VVASLVSETSLNGNAPITVAASKSSLVGGAAYAFFNVCEAPSEDSVNARANKSVVILPLYIVFYSFRKVITLQVRSVHDDGQQTFTSKIALQSISVFYSIGRSSFWQHFFSKIVNNAQMGKTFKDCELI